MVLQSYEEWGDAAFDRFNGMFGFAIDDRKNNRLVLARDHFGIKPLYYTNIGTAGGAQAALRLGDQAAAGRSQGRRCTGPRAQRAHPVPLPAVPHPR